MLPTWLIQHFHRRDFRVATTSQEQLKQLRIWRMQDLFIWLLSGLYIGFCVSFTLIFLANVTHKDRVIWLISSMISLVEMVVFVPFLVASFVTISTASSMHCDE